MFFRIIQHLLPRAKAWLLTTNKQLRQFFEGLAGIGVDVKDYFDAVWLDIFPDNTREISKWEKQFGLLNTLTDEQERRDRLAATWKALGGQSPRYIQDTLRAAGFDVYIHEWWEVPRTEPPVVRNPLLVLVSSGLILYIANCGALEANCGALEANCGASLGPTGYALVNKIQEARAGLIQSGMEVANCGSESAVCGNHISFYAPKEYIVPNDITKWPYFLYIGGQTFPDHAIVPTSRRNEFETLCLKISPTQQWLGMLIDYT